MKATSLLAITTIMGLLATGCNDTTEKTTPPDATVNTTTETTSPAEANKASPSTTTDTTTDGESGEALHQANCSGCHGTEVYTREARQVTSLTGLASRVAMCDANLETQLFPEDLEKITTYLNDSFYKFPK
ncbi:MAG: c-type cytochrome [bacterium]